ncbi:MAG: hypothetical protein HY514_02775 [Candidatus Aenigmarchaeota archaeon]|nr:hypothetical protein [Candidatus Aenigmarchaeota archaeon]
MSVPKCCGVEMGVNVETGKFVEVQCKMCGDVVFVKKGETNKPQMLDD